MLAPAEDHPALAVSAALERLGGRGAIALVYAVAVVIRIAVASASGIVSAGICASAGGGGGHAAC